MNSGYFEVQKYATAHDRFRLLSRFLSPWSTPGGPFNDSRKFDVFMCVSVAWSGLKASLCAVHRAGAWHGQIRESLTSNTRSTPSQRRLTGQVSLCKRTAQSCECVWLNRCICVWVKAAMLLLVLLYTSVCLWTVSSPGLKTFNPARSSSAQKLVGATC